MQLLISVRDAAEAQSALAGGADIIDAKDPARGALGAVTLTTLRAIRSAVGDKRPVSAALGDAVDETRVECAAHEAAAAGVAYVKLGFFGTASRLRARHLLAAAVCGVRSAGEGEGTRGGATWGRPGVIAVACADAASAGSVDPRSIVTAIADAGGAGCTAATPG